MTKLRDLAKVIRSKNAGALLLTLDIMFEDETIAKEDKDNQCMYLLLYEFKNTRDMPLRIIKD